MGEFELIRRYFTSLTRGVHAPTVILGPGDDCAITRPSPGTDLVFSIDTLVEGVHFPRNYDPRHLGWRSLAVATSDLAAMGAEPQGFTLALTLPRADAHWLEGFSSGLADAAASFGIPLLGGDTTRGPLTLSLQVHGSVPCDQAILRSGARPGDLICVSGTLGDAGAALQWLDHPAPTPEALSVLARYHHPVPRLALGQALRGRASAAIDISDGLLADLGHLVTASKVGATIEAQDVPLSAALRQLEGPKAERLAMGAGDDYELCVTLPADEWKKLPADVRQELTRIGEITSDNGVTVVRNGIKEQSASTGYDHFGVNR